MTTSFTVTLQLPQPTIKIAVEYYDAAEKQKLSKYPTHAGIEHVIKSGIEIPTEEFLIYYVFHKKRPGKPGWRNYRQVANQFWRAISELSEWVDFNGASISTHVDLSGQDKAITERIGEGIGLSVISEIHGLTAADWDRIPIVRYSSFDYQIASDGKHIIQIEAKGSAAKDNAVKTSSVSQHKRSIFDKKVDIAAREKQNSYQFPADLRYGTIAVMGESVDDSVKCLLVDPPAEGDGAAARKLRLLQRMRFLRDWISFISPRSQLASALQTRLAALERLPDPFQLDGVPLLKGNGQRFDFTRIGGTLSSHSSFVATKSKITDGPAGGIVAPLPSNDLVFLGIREALLELAAGQSFGRLLEYNAPAGMERKTVVCVITESALRDFRLPPRSFKMRQNTEPTTRSNCRDRYIILTRVFCSESFQLASEAVFT